MRNTPAIVEELQRIRDKCFCPNKTHKSRRFETLRDGGSIRFSCPDCDWEYVSPPEEQKRKAELYESLGG
jgi:hypothetical protein